MCEAVDPRAHHVLEGVPLLLECRLRESQKSQSTVTPQRSMPSHSPSAIFSHFSGLRVPTAFHLLRLKCNARLQVEALILEQFQAIRKSGFSDSAIAAAVNTVEFSLRENDTGSFPRGLSMMLRAMLPWVYERDPYECGLDTCGRQ
jgi:hypothetical protein